MHKVQIAWAVDPAFEADGKINKRDGASERNIGLEISFALISKRQQECDPAKWEDIVSTIKEES